MINSRTAHPMQFKDVKGHLTLVDPKQRRAFKFCSLCGHKIQAEARKLWKHFQGQHHGQKADWLESGCTPSLLTDSSLWEEYKKDPSADFKPSAPGRPKKRDEKHENKAKKVKFAEDMQDSNEDADPEVIGSRQRHVLSSRLHRSKQREDLLKQHIEQCEEDFEEERQKAKKRKTEIKVLEKENKRLHR